MLLDGVFCLNDCILLLKKDQISIGVAHLSELVKEVIEIRRNLKTLMNFLMRSGVSKVSGAVERLKRPLDPWSESESFVSEQSDDVIDSQESNSLTLEDEVRIHAKQKEVSKSNQSRSKKPKN